MCRESSRDLWVISFSDSCKNTSRDFHRKFSEYIPYETSSRIHPKISPRTSSENHPWISSENIFQSFLKKVFQEFSVKSYGFFLQLLHGFHQNSLPQEILHGFLVTLYINKILQFSFYGNFHKFIQIFFQKLLIFTESYLFMYFSRFL